MKTKPAASIKRERDGLISSSFTTSTLHDVLSDEEIEQIQRWTDAWFEGALKLGFVKWPYMIDDAMVSNIQVCYRMKMTPEEAVFFCYRVHGESKLF
ncbi:hypothetical protein [Paraburkholderia ferrariae]|uniref:hypothetical protein n=1 Tax=Paraburkholderia ferrariae TaxID=386056 RepID=UPI0005A63FD7|nr:hypothetical protein [Paraburkholderia ferrariae]